MDKKEEILQAASTVFRRYGFSKATLTDVGNECGLNKAGLYYYFKNKEELLRQMISYDTEEITSNLAQTLEQEHELRSGLKRYILERLDTLKILQHYADMFTNCVVSPSLRDFGIKHRAEFLEKEKKVLANFIEKHNKSNNNITEPLIMIIIGVTENIGKSALLGNIESNIEHKIDQILNLVLPIES